MNINVIRSNPSARWFFQALDEMELATPVHNAIFALGEKFEFGHLQCALEDGLADLVESGVPAEEAFLKIWNSWED